MRSHFGERLSLAQSTWARSNYISTITVIASSPALYGLSVVGLGYVFALSSKYCYMFKAMKKMEAPAVKSLMNYPKKCFNNYYQTITRTNRPQIVQCGKLNRVGTTSLAFKSPRVTKACDNSTKVLDKVKGWVHFVGDGGCGLSALAMLALKQGHEISGSDIMWSNAMDALREAGARVYLGHSELNLRKHNGSVPDALFVSSAIPGGNIEILHAESVGVPMYKRGAWLGRVTESYNLIAISGSHAIRKPD